MTDPSTVAPLPKDVATQQVAARQGVGEPGPIAQRAPLGASSTTVSSDLWMQPMRTAAETGSALTGLWILGLETCGKAWAEVAGSASPLAAAETLAVVAGTFWQEAAGLQLHLAGLRTPLLNDP